MTIRPLTTDDIPRAIEIFQSAYKGMDVPDYEEGDFVAELKASFDTSQVYDLKFFGIEKDNKLVSFAALANSNFYGGSWELRWGTTDINYQKQELMGQLIEYRINEAVKKTENRPGVIQIASRSPHIYLKFGFEPIFTRGPRNQTTYMVKYFNQTYNYQSTEI